jgi:catechol 2,3-dioxygenase-like lactoylglutathione lyase family enzyme
VQVRLRVPIAGLTVHVCLMAGTRLMGATAKRREEAGALHFGRRRRPSLRFSTGRVLRGVRLAPPDRGVLMLTDARITAIVPTTDLARARSFYEETLGLTDSGASTPGPEVVYRCGGGTLLQVYERPTAGDAEHTLASWEVGDVRAAVDELRSRGVRFEDYDFPEFKTEDGVATSDGFQAAWFRDPDGNILCIHSTLGL